MRSTESYKISVLKSPEEFETIRDLWESLVQEPNSQLDFYLLINGARRNDAIPRVILLYKAQEPIALVVGRIVTEPFRLKLAYKTARIGTVKNWQVLFGGVLGCTERIHAELIVSFLRKQLAIGEADIVSFSHLKTTNPIFALLAEDLSYRLKSKFSLPELRWTTNLPPTFEEFLQRLNRKHRYWIRRVENQLTKEYGAGIEFRCFRREDEVDKVAADIEAIAAKTYQRQLNAGFSLNLESIGRLRFEAKHGWLRAYLIYIGKEPCAFWVGSVYKNTFYSNYTGYLPSHRKYELGTIVFMRMVASLCAERVNSIDYGLGDAMYKQRFGDFSTQETTILFYARRPKALFFATAEAFLALPLSIAKALLTRLSLIQTLKTFWRKRLVKRASNDEG